MPILCVKTSFAVTTFSITDIGTLGGDTSGYGINNLGHVTGASYTGGQFHAFYWNGNEMKDLGTFSTQAWGYGGNSVGYALSDKGEIVGRSSIVTAEYGGFYWDPTREYNNMGAVYLNMIDYNYGSGGGGTMPNRQGEVRSINSQGRFAGTIAEELLSSPDRAFYWNGTEAVLLSDPAKPRDLSEAYGINDSDVVAGHVSNTACFWDGSGIHYIAQDDWYYSHARDINNSSYIVGFVFYGYYGAAHAFLWDGENFIDIHDDEVAPGSFAFAINNQGQIVGATHGNDALYWENGEAYILDDLLDGSGDGWDLERAMDINDSGQITGYGTHDGSKRAFLLTPTPVPVPGTMLLLSSGLVALAGARRKFRKG